jgi:hypothetical protein
VSRQSPNGTYWKKRAVLAERKLEYVKKLAYIASCVEYQGSHGRAIEWWTFTRIPGQDYDAGKAPPFDQVLDQALRDGDGEPS